MLSGQICQLAILLRLCITSGYNSWENATPCTQPPMTTMFKLLKSPLYIYIICEAVLNGKVLIEINSFWGGPILWGIFPSLWQPLPILLLDPHSWHWFLISRVRRCLVLPNVVLTFCQGQIMSCIDLSTSNSLVLMWLFPLVIPTVSTTCTSMGRHVLQKICFLYFFKVA